MMKLNKTIILILCLLLSATYAYASERSAISATATVIPVIGIMPTIEQPLSITKSSDLQLLIQAPKTSTFQIHIEMAGETINYQNITSILTPNNSVSDLYSIDLSSNKSTQIITIITTNN